MPHRRLFWSTSSGVGVRRSRSTGTWKSGLSTEARALSAMSPLNGPGDLVICVDRQPRTLENARVAVDAIAEGAGMLLILSGLALLSGAQRNVQP